MSNRLYHRDENSNLNYAGVRLRATPAGETDSARTIVSNIEPMNTESAFINACLRAVGSSILNGSFDTPEKSP